MKTASRPSRKRSYGAITRVGFLSTVVISVIVGVSANAAAQSPPSIRFAQGDVQEIGRAGNPQPYYHVRGQVSIPENIASIHFRIGEGPVRVVSSSHAESTANNLGQFRFAIDRSALDLGINRVTVQCLYRDGTTARKQLVLVKHKTKQALLPRDVEWANVSMINEIGEVARGKWQKTADGFQTRNGSLAIGDPSWIDLDRDIEVEMTFRTGRGSGQTPAIQIRTGWIGIDLDGTDGGSRSAFELPIEPDATFRCRHRVERLATRGFRIRSKSWKAAAPEPDAWQIDRTDKYLNSPPGSVLISVSDIDVTVIETSIRFLPSK